MVDGTWLYAVAGPALPQLPVHLRGVAGEPVRPLRCAQLTAVVGSVDLAEFGEEPLRRSFNDLRWVEHVARGHHEVVEAVAVLCPAIPFRLATIHLDDDRVCAFVAGHQEALGAALHRVAAHAEWGVKAYVGPARVPLADAGGPPAADRPGLAYLMRRRQQLHRREAAWAEGVAHADAVHAALAGPSTAAIRHPVRGDEQSDGAERLVLNAAYLVGHANSARFTDAVRALSVMDGIRLHVTGPWAPYSFADFAVHGADSSPDRADPGTAP